MTFASRRGRGAFDFARKKTCEVSSEISSNISCKDKNQTRSQTQISIYFFCSTASTLQNLCHKHTSFSKSSRDTDHIYKIYLTTHLSFVVFMLIKGAFNFQIIKRSFFLLLLSRMVFIKKQIHPDSLALMVMAPMDPTTISPSDYHLSHPQYLSDAISSKQIERWISKLISSCTYQSQGENVSINKRQHGFFP